MFPTSDRLAFIVFRPVFDTNLFFLYVSAFRRWFVLSISVGLFIVIGLICSHLGLILSS